MPYRTFVTNYAIYWRHYDDCLFGVFRQITVNTRVAEVDVRSWRI